jgi:hypothetical protein
MVYIILLLFFIFLVFNFEIRKNKASNTFFYWFSCFILIIVSGIRYRVGGDTMNYMITHELIPDFFNINFLDLNENIRAEIGWVALTSLTKLLGSEFYWVQFVQSIIVNVSIFIFFKRFTSYYYSCVLFFYIIFYFYFNFEILREALSISIFLLFGIKSLLHEKYLQYYSVVILAILFHTSAVWLLLIPLFIKMLNEKYNYYIICSVIYFLGIVLSPFFSNLLASGIFLNIFANKFGDYLDYNFTITGKIVSYIIFVIFPLLVYGYIKHDKNPLNKYLIIYAIMGSLTAFFPIFFRFINYLTPILILGIVHIFILIVKNRKDRMRVEHALFFALFILVFTNFKLLKVVDESNQIKWYSRWYPYYTIFDNKMDPDREFIWSKQFNK